MAASRCFSGDMDCRRRKSAGPKGHGADAEAEFLRILFEARTAEASETGSAWNSPVPQIRDGLVEVACIGMVSRRSRAEAGFQGLLTCCTL